MFVFQRSNIRNILTTFIILSVCCLTIFKLQSPRLIKEKNSNDSASIEAIKRKAEAKELEVNLLKNAPTFGYDNLVSNWTFLDFIQYFGDSEARNETGYGLTPDYFRIILDRDPRFLNAYFIMSTTSSIYAGKPEESIEIMNEKLQLLSPTDPNRSYYIWRYKGTDELLFLGDIKASQNSFAKAAEWASVYSNEEGQRVARLSGETAQFLASNPDITTAQTWGWQMVYNNSRDDRTRQVAVEKIEALGAKVSIDSQGNLIIEMLPQNN